MTGDRDTLTDEERLESLKAWQETWKDKGYPYPVPTASFLAGFDAAAARVRAAQAQAWDRLCNYLDDHVDSDVRESVKRAARDSNPYRSDAGDEFQNP